MPKVMTLDVEATGLDWLRDRIYLVGYRVDYGNVIQFEPSVVGWPSDFVAWLADPNVVKRGHNIKYDILMLKAAGLEVKGLLDCTQVLSYLENPFDSVKLKDLVENKLKKDVTRMDDFGFKLLKKDAKYLTEYADHYFVGHDGLWFRKDLMYEYNRADVINCDELRKDVIATDWYTNVEQPLIQILVDVESRGTQLDRPYLEKLNKDYLDKLAVLVARLEGLENPNAPVQVAKFLGLPEGSSTDKLILKKLAWEGNQKAKDILEYRKIKKLHSTYVLPLLQKADEHSRIHGSFNQAGREKSDGDGVKGTRTGRLSSSDPNLQNIPARTEEGNLIRQAFVPSLGKRMADADLKQIEPRAVAHYTQNPLLLKAFAEGIDTHALMASVIFERPLEDYSKENLLKYHERKVERFIGKTSWLADFYGCYAPKLKEICERNSDDPLPYDLAYYEDVQRRLRANNPQLYEWREQHIATVRSLGYVQTVGGRVIHIPSLHSRRYGERMEAERRAVNYQIQGSCADIMKLITVRMHRELPFLKMLAFVHDEILCEYDEEYDDAMALWHINDVMGTTVFFKNVAIEADAKVVTNWSEK